MTVLNLWKLLMACYGHNNSLYKYVRRGACTYIHTCTHMHKMYPSTESFNEINEQQENMHFPARKTTSEVHRRPDISKPSNILSAGWAPRRQLRASLDRFSRRRRLKGTRLKPNRRPHEYKKKRRKKEIAGGEPGKWVWPADTVNPSNRILRRYGTGDPPPSCPPNRPSRAREAVQPAIRIYQYAWINANVF